MVKKKAASVPRVFKCIFCNGEETVTVRMDAAAGLADLSCRLCGEAFQTRIHSLSDPIDVFSEWLDETQERQLREG